NLTQWLEGALSEPRALTSPLFSRYSSRFPDPGLPWCQAGEAAPASKGSPSLNLVAASLKIRRTGDTPMSELETTAGMSVVEKRKAQKAELRPLANRRPELYDEDEYSSAEYEQMMEMYNGTLASIDEGEI